MHLAVLWYKRETRKGRNGTVVALVVVRRQHNAKKIKSATFLVFWFSWGCVVLSCVVMWAVINKQGKRRRSVCVVLYRSMAIPQGTRHRRGC